MHYKAIILAIYNESLDVYSLLKQKSHSYYSRFFKDIKVFYITFRENQNEEIIEEGEFLFVRGTESFKPGIITKTMRALKYISQQYSYNYAVRTNVSTIINCKNLLDYFNTIPKTNYTGGFVIFDSFYSGIFVLFSKDMAEVLSSIDLQYENIYEEMDDVLIMQLIQKRQLPVFDITPTKYRIEYCTAGDVSSHNDIGEDIEKYESVLCYRIRNDVDRNVDLQYSDKIYKYLFVGGVGGYVDSDPNSGGEA